MKVPDWFVGPDSDSSEKHWETFKKYQLRRYYFDKDQGSGGVSGPEGGGVDPSATGANLDNLSTERKPKYDT